eukprot:258987_1
MSNVLNRIVNITCRLVDFLRGFCSRLTATFMSKPDVSWEEGLQSCEIGETLESDKLLTDAYTKYNSGLQLMMSSLKRTSNVGLKKNRRAVIDKYMTHAEALKNKIEGKTVSTSSSAALRRNVRQPTNIRARGRGRGNLRSKPNSVSRNALPARRPSETDRSNSEYQKRIENEILNEELGVAFEDIAGLDYVKQVLFETVILPAQRPDVFTGLRAPPKGVLLFGPPGNGKTMVAKAVASESHCTFFNISASSLTSKWVGESEKLMRALFEEARRRQPSIIFIDEIDSLLTSRGGSKESEGARRLKTEFLVQFDGVSSNADDRILVMGATNIPQELDDAVLRRFSKRIQIPLPEPATRAHLLNKLLSDQKSKLSRSDLDRVVAATQGYSCSDLAQLAKDAAMGPVRDAGKAITKRNFKSSDIRPIVFRHFEESLQAIRPSVPADSLRVINEWDQKFGSRAALGPKKSPVDGQMSELKEMDGVPGRAAKRNKSGIGRIFS